MSAQPPLLPETPRAEPCQDCVNAPYDDGLCIWCWIKRLQQGEQPGQREAMTERLKKVSELYD